MSAAVLSAVAVTAAPCARCAALQRTCCQRAEVLLTRGDVARIGASSGRLDFWEQRAPADASYLDHDPGDPRWRALTVAPDGTRRMLRRRPGGDCTFLGARGCELPLEVRPLVCRLYPLGYNEAGLTGREEHYCPTWLLSPEGRAMAEVLEMDLGAARRWHATLYRELEEEHHGRS
jgi:Fe-S-cluster containining protein